MTGKARKALVIVAGVLLVLAAAAAVVYQRYTAAGDEAKELTAPAVARDLPVEEIRAKLQSGNFREKLAAKKQIEKLEPTDRVAVLAALLQDPDVATRLIAVSALGDLGSDEARTKLAEVAAKDGDEKVRAAATEALASPAPAPGPAPAPEGGTP